MSATLEFARASRWYGQLIALNDVTTTIAPGVTGLLGPNGAGKSTFLKLAAGQLRPSQGEVRVLGLPAWGSPELFHRVGLCHNSMVSATRGPRPTPSGRASPGCSS